MSPVRSADIGIETALDVIEDVLRDKLNDTMAERDAEIYLPADQARAVRRGVDYIQWPLEPVRDSAFHVGSIPSMVNDTLPPDAFPYVAITVADIVPEPEDAVQDHQTVRGNQISVHSLAKATVAETPEAVFRRAVRMADCIDHIARTDLRLSTLLRGRSNPSRIRMSEPFWFAVDEHGFGSEALWQAAGVDFIVISYQHT